MSSLLELVIHNAETKEAQMKWEGSKAIAVNIETTDVTGLPIPRFRVLEVPKHRICQKFGKQME